MTFKKDGVNPVFSRRPAMGLSFVGEMFELLGIGVVPPQPEDVLRFKRSRRKVNDRKRRPNRLIISKRVRRKHRRARR